MKYVILPDDTNKAAETITSTVKYYFTDRMPDQTVAVSYNVKVEAVTSASITNTSGNTLSLSIENDRDVNVGGSGELVFLDTVYFYAQDATDGAKREAAEKSIMLLFESGCIILKGYKDGTPLDSDVKVTSVSLTTKVTEVVLDADPGADYEIYVSSFDRKIFIKVLNIQYTIDGTSGSCKLNFIDDSANGKCLKVY